MANRRDYEITSGNPEGPLEILNNPADTGYFVKLPNKSAQNSDTWNAVLVTTDNQELKLWIEDLVLNFSMSGTSGQSRYRRQFYPKAFNQPSMMVKGKMPNQFEYNKLAAFIRESHFDALNQTNRRTAEDGSQAVFDKKTVTLHIKNAGEGSRPKRNIKGGHIVLAFEGYVKNIEAGARKFQFAPDFQFEFVVAGSKDTGNIGIYSDDIIQGSKIMSWMDLFKKDHFSNSAEQPTDPNAPAPTPGSPDGTTGVRPLGWTPSNPSNASTGIGQSNNESSLFKPVQ